MKHLIRNNSKVTNVKDIADAVAETFSINSSSNNANKQFLNYKGISEKPKLKFESENTESYMDSSYCKS